MNNRSFSGPGRTQITYLQLESAIISLQSLWNALAAPIRQLLRRRVVDLYLLEWVGAKVQVRGMSEGLKTCLPVDLHLSFVRLEW